MAEASPTSPWSGGAERVASKPDPAGNHAGLCTVGGALTTFTGASLASNSGASNVAASAEASGDDFAGARVFGSKWQSERIGVVCEA